jgi:hypothetical protein
LVKGLDEALVETERRILEREPRPEDTSRWAFALEAWEQAWVRLSPFLANQEVHDRYEAVGRILSELTMYDGAARPGFQRNAVMQATLNARQAIAYFGREEAIAPQCFPKPEELTRLLGEGDPDPLDARLRLRHGLRIILRRRGEPRKRLATIEVETLDRALSLNPPIHHQR